MNQYNFKFLSDNTFHLFCNGNDQPYLDSNPMSEFYHDYRSLKDDEVFRGLDPEDQLAYIQMLIEAHEYGPDYGTWYTSQN